MEITKRRLADIVPYAANAKKHDKRQINNVTTERGGTVLDLFGGSGSTLIACEQLDRRCCMMELDPRYCDVIIKRWEQFTGEKAVLLHDD